MRGRQCRTGLLACLLEAIKSRRIVDQNLLAGYRIGRPDGELIQQPFRFDFRDASYVGFGNYRTLWHDHQFWTWPPHRGTAIWNTFYYTAIVVPAQMALGLALALAVNAKLRGLMLKAFQRVRDLARQRRLTMRMAALILGVEKVAREKLRRGLFP